MAKTGSKITYTSTVKTFIDFLPLLLSPPVDKVTSPVRSNPGSATAMHFLVIYVSIQLPSLANIPMLLRLRENDELLAPVVFPVIMIVNRRHLWQAFCAKVLIMFFLKLFP